MYKLQPNTWQNNPATTVLNTETLQWIPFDPANTDAAEFAKWLQSGNKPEPAEEGDVVTDEWVAETIVKLLP